MFQHLTNHTQPKNSRRNGFTLIELLVVIAIIAILAAILFPVFARARENARRTSCLSNMKQINLGMMQYTQDYDEHYPNYYWNNGTQAPGPENGGEWYPSATSTNWFWQNMIYPYVKSVQVFICPSSPSAGQPYKAPSGVYGPYTQPMPAQVLFPPANGALAGRTSTSCRHRPILT